MNVEYLTPRELEVLRLIARGNRYREVAVELGVSAQAVSVHASNAMGALSARNIPQVVALLDDQDPGWRPRSVVP